MRTHIAAPVQAPANANRDQRIGPSRNDRTATIAINTVGANTSSDNTVADWFKNSGHVATVNPAPIAPMRPNSDR